MFRQSCRASRRFHVAVPVLMCAALAACASGGAARYADEDAPVAGQDMSAAPKYALVNNYSGERVTVFISQGSGTFRLGDVEAYGRRMLPLSPIAAALRDGRAFFVARPLAGAAYRSESFPVSPARTPVWTIESKVVYSSVSLR